MRHNLWGSVVVRTQIRTESSKELWSISGDHIKIQSMWWRRVNYWPIAYNSFHLSLLWHPNKNSGHWPFHENS